MQLTSGDVWVLFGPRREKTCLWGFANNKGAGQPAQTYQRLCYSFSGKYHIKTCFERNFTILANLCSLAGWFWYELIRNPEDRFWRDEGHLV